MTKASRFLVPLVAAIFLIGCGAQPGKNIVKYEKHSALPLITQAPQDGTYALYSTWDTTSIISYPLMKNDRIGFDKNADDKVVAVAGSNSYPLKTDWTKGSYYWKLQKNQ